MLLNRKVKAYTLMELGVVLILSGILFAMAYQVLHFVQSGYSQFENKNGHLIKNKMLLSRLRKDCARADLLLATYNEIRCLGKDNNSVIYTIELSYIIRQQGIVNDTFLLKNTLVKTYFKGQETPQETLTLVDEVHLESEYQKDKIRFSIFKQYGADQLFHQNLVEGLNE